MPPPRRADERHIGQMVAAQPRWFAEENDKPVRRAAPLPSLPHLPPVPPPRPVRDEQQPFEQRLAALGVDLHDNREQELLGYLHHSDAFEAAAFTDLVRELRQANATQHGKAVAGSR